ncbi:uncharacterized protein LOC144206826 [Stigmatopora nigra]
MDEDNTPNCLEVHRRWRNPKQAWPRNGNFCPTCLFFCKFTPWRVCRVKKERKSQSQLTTRIRQTNADPCKGKMDQSTSLPFQREGPFLRPPPEGRRRFHFFRGKDLHYLVKGCICLALIKDCSPLVAICIITAG